MLALLLVPNIFAEVQTLGTFEKGKCIELLQTCSNCTYNNISSISYPNSTQALNQSLMTKIGTKYNYTFCNTNTSGQYIVNGFGDIDGSVTVWAYDFIINPTGIESTQMRTDSTSRAIWIIFIMAIAFFVSFLILQNPSVRYTFLVVSMIFTVITLNLIFVTLTNEVTDTNILSLFDTISAASFYFYWFGAGIIFIIWVLTLLNTIYERFSKQRYDKFNVSLDGGKYG